MDIDDLVLDRLYQRAMQSGHRDVQIERRIGNGRHGGAGWYVKRSDGGEVFLGATWQESLAALAKPDFTLTPEERDRAGRANETLR